MTPITPFAAASGVILLPSRSFSRYVSMDYLDEICLSVFGKPSLRVEQRSVITAVLEDENVIGIIATGAGKSLTFQLPFLLTPGITLIISPLVALIQNQVENLPKGIKERVIVLTGDNRQLQRDINNCLAQHNRCLVYTSPEKLYTFLLQNVRFGSKVARFVLDEAHCASEWGNTFRASYLKLPELWAALQCPPIQAMTATASSGTIADLIALFQTPFTIIQHSVYRRNLHISSFDHQTTNARDNHFLQLIRHKVGPTIVYAKSRMYVERTAAWLNKLGIAAIPFHAGLDASIRKVNQDVFVSSDADLLIATIAFGMGIDKSNVRHVIHIEPPETLEDYQQQVGRAGRDGAAAWCVMFDTFNKKRLREENLRRQIDQCKRSGENTFGSRLVKRQADMQQFLLCKHCRHRYLAIYNNELPQFSHCGHCDNCVL